MNSKKPTPRQVWRMTVDAPSGELVDLDPTQPDPALGDLRLKVLKPAPVADWRASSYDLLSGVEVRDHTDTIPGGLFDKLFKR